MTHNPTPQPDSPEVKTILEQLSDSSASRGWLDCKSGSEDTHPRDDLIQIALTKLDEYYTNKFLEIVGEDEPEKKDAKLYTGYSDKDWDTIKVPNKSAIQRNKFRAKLRTAIKNLNKNDNHLNQSKGEDNEQR